MITMQSTLERFIESELPDNESSMFYNFGLALDVLFPEVIIIVYFVNL